MEVPVTYFERKGSENTVTALRLAYDRAKALKITHVISMAEKLEQGLSVCWIISQRII